MDLLVLQTLYEQIFLLFERTRTILQRHELKRDLLHPWNMQLFYEEVKLPFWGATGEVLLTTALRCLAWQ